MAAPLSPSEFGVLVAIDVLGLSWLWAAAGKARDLAGFVRASRDLLPQALHPAIPLGARMLPGLETALGLLLVVHRLVVPALGASCILLVFFSVVLLRARARGITTACACFGAHTTSPISRVTVVRTTLLLTLAVMLLAANSATSVGALHPSTAERGLVILLAILLTGTGAVLASAVRLITTVEREVRPKHRRAGAVM